MNREKILGNLRERENSWDIIIIGGGASGVGCAVDASSRGFDVLLLEQNDFGKGTSSRSTKLIHGGVRYLKRGDISLVREALRERGILMQNAPHLVKSQPFIIPCYSLLQKFYYGAGLRFYDLLAGKHGFEKSRVLSRRETMEKLPSIVVENLKGGVVYFDGQFDDARLLIDLVKTAANKGAAVLNYAKVFEFQKNQRGKISGLTFENARSGEVFTVQAKVVINATGAFCDSIRRLSNERLEDIISPSQGIHLVFDGSLLASNYAVMIPKTSDGRVLFAIPWKGKTIVGTTDTPVKQTEIEPKPFEEEIEFLLETCRNYFTKPPKREDVLSVFAGIRPLVKSSQTKTTTTISRNHMLEVSESDLLTLTGGKWTTYRQMAEDAIDKAIELGDLPVRTCVTMGLKIEDEKPGQINELLRENSEFSELLCEDLPFQKSEIVHSVRNEMALTLEDVLARRKRILFLDAKLAIEIAPSIAEIMAKELGKDKEWVDQEIKEFKAVAQNYLVKH